MEAVTRLTLTTIIRDKLSRGVEYISKYSIYPYTVKDDYNSAQCCLATLLYFLMSGDVEGFLVTKRLSEQLLQMRSSYIKVWLLEDFKFDRMDMMRALNTLSRIVANQQIYSFSPIVDIITGLEKKYNLEGNFVKMAMELPAHSSTAKNIVYLRCNDSEGHTSEDLTTIQNLELETSTSIATQTIVERPLMKVDSDTFLSAVKSNNKRYVNELLSEDVSAEDKERALLEASKAGFSDIVRMLVSSGADVGYKDECGNTSLHLAAKEGKVECVGVLLDVAGVDVDMKGPFDETALNCASMEGYLEVVRLLLAKGANVNSRERNKRTPLHWAAWNGQSSVVEVLVSSGADINAVDNNNKTTLHWAAIKGHSSLVEVLVSSGADINAVDNFNETPLNTARHYNNHTVVNFLKSKGAR